MLGVNDIGLKTTRRRTVSQVRSQSPIRDRNRTYHEFMPLKGSDDQYAELALESVKKNYLVGNLKPFAVDKGVFTELKTEVSALKEVPTPKNNNFYDKKSSIQNKFAKLLTTALGFKSKNHQKRKKRNNIKSQIFIASQIQDDHQNLMQDYQQQLTHERANRQKTIQTINKHLIRQYESFIDKGSGQLNKNKIVKFKKSYKVVRTYANNDDIYRPAARNYKDILQLEKEDYGIYSRSCNKTLYYGKNQGEEDRKQERSMGKDVKITKTFYKSYLGSYSQRKNILRHSDVSLKC